MKSISLLENQVKCVFDGHVGPASVVGVGNNGSLDAFPGGAISEMGGAYLVDVFSDTDGVES